ncbi:MAG: penicillin-binding protein [Candidatus Roizmanbacteria bacterium]|nr:MAG: penicillin-binding protein [Candidatus Roizmanbacteria bacterium]
MEFWKNLLQKLKAINVKKVLLNYKFLLATVVPLLGFLIFIYFFIFYNLPSPSKLKDYRSTPLSTHIYDRNGKLLYEVYKDENRTPVKLKDLPPYIAKATIAIEDKDFYRHGGISFISGIFRAIKDTILKKNLQGGSTLTQQLIKSALLTPERTIQRKIKEIILAIWAERMYTKDQILEMYLNQVAYGGSSYGIEEATRTYFGKQAKELTLDEAALLAGLPQAPSLYSPHYNPDIAKTRRNEVLKKMKEQKYMDEKKRKEQSAKPVTVVPPKINIKAPHFVFYVKSLLEEKYDVDQIEQGGLRVYTTLDLDIQEQAEKILKEEIEKLEGLNVSNGAVLVTRPTTGEILAMVGSQDYFATPSGAFNVTTSLRQPGSAIKPINYAIGIDRQLVTPATVFLDAKTCFKSIPQPYCPVNYDGIFHGPVQLRFALGSSYNVPAVKMLAINGVDNFVASSSAFTITSFKDPQRYGLALTLGGGEVRMTELAQAFSAFSNRGKPRTLNAILDVQDKIGKKLYEFKDFNFVKDIHKPLIYPNFLAIPGKKSISVETSFLISHILLDNNARAQAFGSSSFLVIPKKAVSVKTGTTDDKKDNWTIGYTPNFLTAVWVGNNDGSPMNQYLTSGITGAAPIWNKIMNYILKDQPDLWPIMPDTIIGKQVCNDTGKLASKDQEGKENCSSRFEYFIKGTEDKQSVTVKREPVPVNKNTDKLAQPGEPDIEMKEKTIMKDDYSIYCVDCAHDPTPTPVPH